MLYNIIIYVVVLLPLNRKKYLGCAVNFCQRITVIFNIYCSQFLDQNDMKVYCNAVMAE